MSSVHIPKRLHESVSERALFRCEYCQTQELLIGALCEIDHIVPVSANGETIEDNLCLACWRCNRTKGASTMGLDTETGKNVPLFNPRRQQWEDHFKWHRNGVEIVGLTSVGRATIDKLNMNNFFVVRSRTVWREGGWHPPQS